MTKLMNKFYNNPNKPMAEVNADYIEHLKQVVAHQTEVKKQTERALIKAKAFNPRLDMIMAHYNLSEEFYRNNEIIDEWEPNV